MSPHSRFESLPAELLLGVLIRCSREDLANLAQTCSNLRAACRKELVNYPLTMKVTSDSLKCWVAYFRKEDTPLTRGARSLDIDISIKITMQDLLNAFDDIDPTVFDVDARPIHPDASRILPLPSSLRKLSLKLEMMPSQDVSSETLLLLLLRSLPEQCPYLEELSIQADPEHPSDEFDRCIHRLIHLRKLHLDVRNLPNIPNRLSLLPASLTDLTSDMTYLQTQEEVTTTVAWVRGIRNIELALGAPQGIGNTLMVLSRGGATHLTKLILREFQGDESPADVISLGDALTVGLQEFSFLQPALHTLELMVPSAWSNSLHFPLLHTAVASTLTKLTLLYVDPCIFPSHLPWPRLQSLELKMILKMGYEGPLTEPIFPVLTALSIFAVDEIQASDDLFPSLETIEWQTDPTPEQVASLVRHDIKRIDMAANYLDGRYESLWKAMGGHTIDLIALDGQFSDQMKELAKNGERIFPGSTNIREFTIKWGEDDN